MKLLSRTFVVGVVAVIPAALLLPPSAESDTSLEPNELVPLLDTVQDERDLPPPGMTREWQNDIRPESVRLIEDTDLGAHWIAESTKGEICLISHSERSHGGTTSTTCSTPYNFHRHGLGSSYIDHTLEAGQYEAVYAFPADVELSPSPELSRAPTSAYNVLVIKGPHEHMGIIELPREDGGTYLFAPLPDRDDRPPRPNERQQ